MSDTGLKSPQTTGDDYNTWTNPADAYADDGYNAIQGDNADRSQDYYTFDFLVPNIATGILGIEVQAKGATQSGNIDLYVGLSWDGGGTYTSEKSEIFTGYPPYQNKTFGGPTDNWGRAWTTGNFNNTNFRLRVRTTQGGMLLDHIQVKVYFTLPLIGDSVSGADAAETRHQAEVSDNNLENVSHF